MGSNIVEKILSEHLVEGTLKAGEEIAVRIDQTLTQDATGTMAFLQFEAMGIDRVQNDLALSYVDHNTIQVGFENADDHEYLRTAAARYGAVYSRPGNGICHQLHLERFSVPGRTLLGSDSHTPTGGGIGMFAMGAGGIDVAAAMGGGPFHMTSPRVVEIRLEGSLKPWVTAKDVILHVLSIFGTKGNVGTVFEYTGEGAAGLTVPQRATITNMGAECGVTTSVFPSDQMTRAFLKSQGREDAWRELIPDADAVYDQSVTVNLSELEPLAAAPHSPGNIIPIRELAGLRVDQVCVGSCTNSSYADLRTVAEILKGRTVAPQVSMGIASGSRAVMLMMAEEGHLASLIRAGVRILENACGFCIGNSLSPGSNEVSLRTINRNFEGRSGTQSAQVYLVSPEAAALAALHGEFVDPLGQSEIPCPEVDMPGAYVADDSMFIFPPKEGSGGEIKRGPNIGDPPANQKLPEDLIGEAAIKVGEKITTDHIMPAGQRLKYRSNIPEYAQFVFEHVDPRFPARAEENREKGLHNFIIAGASYGQGSSREHAALCPMYLGVKAVIAVSIERIHMANLFNFGILPLVFTDPDDYQRIEQGDKLEIRGIRNLLTADDPPPLSVSLHNLSKGTDIPLTADFSQRQRSLLLAGGLLNLTREKLG